MATKSKEQDVLRLILENSPLKEWHFEEIVKTAKFTRMIASKWLKKYVKEGLLKRIKERGRFPYFTVGSNNAVYYSLKKIYLLEELHKSGLLPRLFSLENAKTIIIFGSSIKGDWYKNSDIDIFIYGNADELDKDAYELKLKRHIELHLFENKQELEEVNTGLIRNVINGYVVKGQIQDIVEVT
ncbi:nucleotidyltransferase domain-containing protein [Candidatus Woesearchaeota archaeon]|nr:nucleotidyltransferase domain-containing protein [Candidatus Woesearchaeota archaeon]